MIEYYQKLTAGEGLGRIKTAREADIWAHSHATAQEIDELVTTYDLDRNIVSDVRDARELPRVEFSGHNLYVFVRNVESGKSCDVSTHPLLAVITPKLYLTLSPHNTFNPQRVPAGLVQTTTNPQDLLTATLATIIADYEQQVHRTGEMIAKMRKRLHTREINNEDFVTFVTIEDDLNDYRTNLSSTLGVIRRLVDNRHKTFNGQSLEFLEDIALHIEQLLASVASHAQSAGSIQKVYGTIAKNRLNQRMKILTVLTVLLTMPNVFYGMYGMNVPLPYQNEAWVYPAIVLFTFGLILVVLLLAKRFRLF